MILDLESPAKASRRAKSLRDAGATVMQDTNAFQEEPQPESPKAVKAQYPMRAQVCSLCVFYPQDTLLYQLQYSKSAVSHPWIIPCSCSGHVYAYVARCNIVASIMIVSSSRCPILSRRVEDCCCMLLICKLSMLPLSV